MYRRELAESSSHSAEASPSVHRRDDKREETLKLKRGQYVLIGLFLVVLAYLPLGIQVVTGQTQVLKWGQDRNQHSVTITIHDHDSERQSPVSLADDPEPSTPSGDHEVEAAPAGTASPTVEPSPAAEGASGRSPPPPTPTAAHLPYFVARLLGWTDTDTGSLWRGKRMDSGVTLKDGLMPGLHLSPPPPWIDPDLPVPPKSSRIVGAQLRSALREADAFERGLALSVLEDDHSQCQDNKMGLTRCNHVADALLRDMKAAARFGPAREKLMGKYPGLREIMNLEHYKWKMAENRRERKLNATVTQLAAMSTPPPDDSIYGNEDELALNNKEHQALMSGLSARVRLGAQQNRADVRVAAEGRARRGKPATRRGGAGTKAGGGEVDPADEDSLPESLRDIMTQDAYDAAKLVTLREAAGAVSSISSIDSAYGDIGDAGRGHAKGKVADGGTIRVGGVGKKFSSSGEVDANSKLSDVSGKLASLVRRAHRVEDDWRDTGAEMIEAAKKEGQAAADLAGSKRSKKPKNKQDAAWASEVSRLVPGAGSAIH